MSCRSTVSRLVFSPLVLAVDLTPLDPSAFAASRPTCILRKISFEVLVGFRKDFRRELARSRI